MTALKFRAFAFLGAFLMFASELMVARRILPQFGSSAAVWTTSLMFFQAAVFVGYLIAGRWPAWTGRKGAALHAAVLLAPLVSFPFHFVRLEGVDPIVAVVVVLSFSLGPSFLVLSTASVLAQRWFSATDHPEANNPWFLYGISNAGSLIGLAAYPLLIEPLLGMESQLLLYYAGFACFALLHWASRAKQPLPKAASEPEPGPEAAPDHPMLWLLLAAAGSALLTAVTNIVTIDASVPLLWAIPLTVYLITLIIVFARKLPSFTTVSRLCLGALILAGVMIPVGKFNRQFLQLTMIVLHCSILFVGALLCHWNMVRARPASTARLGAYYLRISLGGWLGTALIAVVVPVVLGWLAVAYLDYAVASAVILAALLLRDKEKLTAWARTHLGGAVAGGFAGFVVLGAIGLGTYATVKGRIDGSRTFYGLYQVKDQDGLRWLHHGNTVHGIESLDPAEKGEPLAYFHRGAPIAEILSGKFPTARVGVVGLGIGTLAAYMRPGDDWDFYELDPEVERLARVHFGYLAGTKGTLRVILGDARLSLANTPDGSYDVLVLDAFSSDFLPVHLLTREALQLYLSKLRPGGILVFNISNRVFDFIPILGDLAGSLSISAAHEGGVEPPPDELAKGHFASRWMVVGPKELVEPLGWTPAPPVGGRVWTDDYVNLIGALRR